MKVENRYWGILRAWESLAFFTTQILPLCLIFYLILYVIGSKGPKFGQTDEKNQQGLAFKFLPLFP